MQKPEMKATGQCINNLKVIGEAIDRFKIKTGKYPNTLCDLKKDYLPSDIVINCPANKKDKSNLPYEYKKPRGNSPGDFHLIKCVHKVFGYNYEFYLQKDGQIRVAPTKTITKKEK